MGFYSWTCSVTKKSIPYNYQGEVVLVLPNDKTIRGHYNGYGCIDGKDVIFEVAKAMNLPVKERDDCFKGEDRYESIMKQVKIVLHYAYTGQKFKQLKTSKSCKYQGFFYTRTCKKIFPADYQP